MPPILEQLKQQFLAISLGRRLLMLGILVAAGIGIQSFVGWQKERGLKPIYSGLSAEDAGQVTQKLKESGVEYRLGESGSSILVPEERIPELRLEMATAGIPRTGRIGFELFDRTSFGTTDFAEHVNYRRAVEGELARSVMALSEVEDARVHVTFPKDSIYTESRQAAKASVLLKLRPGVTLAPPSVSAVTHLVSSAVEGLSPDQVSVLDMRGRLLNKPRRGSATEGEEASELTLELQQRIEKELLLKIQATLTPLLGEDKFRSAVSVECERNSGEESAETFDPDKSVLVSSQSSIDSIRSPGAASGTPGVAANQPGSTPTAATLPSTSRKTETNSYQTSRTVRKMKLSQGAISSLSISVLLDQGVRWEKSGSGMQRVLIPPSPDTIKVIRELISGVTGLKKERGDQLIVESLPFESTMNAEPPPQPALPPANKQAPGVTVFGVAMTPETAMRDPRVLGATGALVLLLAGGVFLLMRSAKRKRGNRIAAEAAARALPSGKGLAVLDTALSGDRQIGASEPAQEEADLLESARREVQSNPEVFASVIQIWLAEVEAK
jgi:flagellar M-ring protein FliF